MINFDTQLLLNKVESLRLHLPVEWAIYDVTMAEEIAEKEIPDAKWEEIFATFADEAQGLFGALFETFADCVRQAVDIEEDE